MTYSKSASRPRLIGIHTGIGFHGPELDVAARIGPNYQVDIPELEYLHEVADDYQDDSILLWQPNEDKVDDNTLDNYLNEVKNKYGIDSLQALSVLFRLNYNVQEAIEEICRIAPH